jgi:hypothetical protein
MNKLFPNFALLPIEIKRKIVLLKFFDLKCLMDIEENFGMDPIDIDAGVKISKKAREFLKNKTYGWTGFARHSQV